MSDTLDLTRAELVYESLKQRIVSLQFEPGMPIQEAEISKLYDASRTPIREALARLTHEGFVVRWGRGYRVRGFAPAEVKELYEIREALEKMAVRLTIENASKKALEGLERQLAQYAEFIASGDIKSFNLHANRFHTTIAELSGNRNLAESIALLQEKVRIISARYLVRAKSIQHAYDEHMRIYNAIARRDVVVAEALMRDHIQSVVQYFKTIA